MNDVIAAPATASEPAPGKIIFRRIRRMLRPHYPTIALAVMFLILSSPAELFPGLTWMYVTDALILKHPTGISDLLGKLFSLNGHITNPIHLLFSAVVWMFVIYVFAESSETLSTYLMSIVAQKFTLSVRNQVYAKLQSQSLAYLQRQRVGDLMSRAMGDVDELQSFLVNGIDQILGEGLLWFEAVALVMVLDWKVASLSLSPLLVVYVLLRYFNKKVGPIYKAARDAAGEVSTRLQENLSGIVVIKIFAREKQEAQRFHQTTDGYFRQQLRAIRARYLFFPITRGVGFFSNVFMIGVGGYSILTGGSFTVGKLLAFRAYWWRLFGPINTLARVNDMVQRAVAAGRRVFEVLDAPDDLPDAPDAVEVEHFCHELVLRNVDFGYRSMAVPAMRHGRDGHATSSNGAPSELVLRHISISISSGQKIALCGPSGSGKSTILSLLLRFYDPNSGAVTFDGVDLRQIKRDSLRKHFALVQQESFLFNDSIFDNIRYGHGEATMQQVIAAAEAANIHDFISRLPEGYDTKVGERGVRLSGGQKQRISIARAFLANPEILLLDEPTSSVEPDSEAAIIAALDRLMAGRTTVLTSHRPSLINQADYIYVIEDGRVSEQGSPGELMGNNGWFARFMRSAEEAIGVKSDEAT